jgi:hypothetical protein
VGLNGGIILKWILSRVYTGFIWLRVGPWNPVVNLQAPSNYYFIDRVIFTLGLEKIKLPTP